MVDLFYGLVFFGYIAIFLAPPVFAAGLGALSLTEVLGFSWHRPNLITRSLGGLGLLVSLYVGLLWLFLVAQAFLGAFYPIP